MTETIYPPIFRASIKAMEPLSSNLIPVLRGIPVLHDPTFDGLDRPRILAFDAREGVSIILTLPDDWSLDQAVDALFESTEYLAR
jgi:hypothetical protein